MTRIAMQGPELIDAVEAVVEAWVAEGLKQAVQPTQAQMAQAVTTPVKAGEIRPAFTAYNVTQALRAANPSRDIQHEPVREIVHQTPILMAAMAAGAYTRTLVPMPNGNSANVYTPVAVAQPTIVAPAVQAAPALPPQAAAPAPAAQSLPAGVAGLLIDNAPLHL